MFKEIDFSAKLIGKIDSGEEHIFRENINTENEYYSKVFYNQNKNMIGVFFSCVYYGYLRIHIAFTEDTSMFNDEISTLITSTIQKSDLKKGRIWIKNDTKCIIDYVRMFFRITPNCGIYDYTSEEFIMRRANFIKKIDDKSLVIKPFEEKYIVEYLALLDNAMDFVSPVPDYLSHKDNYLELFNEKKTENSFEAFWKDDELIGLYWRDGAEIEIMAVNNNHQRQGYGTEILTRAIDMALINTEKEFVYLYAVDWNEKGRAFYRKYGMELTAHSFSFSIENFKILST